MSSASTDRPSGAMTTAVSARPTWTLSEAQPADGASKPRPTRFPEFGAAPGRHNSESSPSATRGPSLGNGGAWQPSGAIWGSNPIGSGYASSKKDPAKPTAMSALRGQARAVPEVGTAGEREISDALSGSKALAEQSEADPWGARTNGPWNPPDTTSPTLQSHRGSTPPNHSRQSIANAPAQTLLEAQNQYHPARPSLGPGPAFRPQSKSSLNPSSGIFQVVQKGPPSFAYHEDKENATPYLKETYDVEIPSRYLPIGSSAAREGSTPPTKLPEPGRHGGSISVASGHPPFGSTGLPTPQSSLHSQRPSISGRVGSYPSQAHGMRYDRVATEEERGEKFAGFVLGREADPAHNSSQGGSHAGLAPFPHQPGFALPKPAFSNPTPVWSDGPGARATNNKHDAYPAPPFAEQTYIPRGGGRFPPEKGSVSPEGGEYRRGLNSSPNYYPGSGTPPSGPDQAYLAGPRGSRALHGPADLERRLQNLHLQQQQQQQQQAYAYHLYHQQFQGQYPVIQYEVTPPTYRPGNLPYGYPVPVPTYASALPPLPTRPAKDHDAGVGVRSVLLEEFRSNGKSGRKFELKEIYNHLVEFSGDQHGSRFIQKALETANSDEKAQLFREIQPNALQLMTDVFGNYVIQKMFEHGSQVQKRAIAEQMKNHVMELSLQMYGCRVVQKALEHVLADQQAELAQELRVDVLRCVKDQNGNHVLQKAIERVPTEHVRFVIEAFRGQVHALSAHPYGCRVIQRILEFCKHQDQLPILEELHQCSTALITDQYGNYVTQHIIKHGRPDDRAKIIQLVTSQLLALSKHKFASNVVETSIEFGTPEQRRAIVAGITQLHSDGTSPLQLMIKDQFGNYVIQKLINQLEGAERASLVDAIKTQLSLVKRFNSLKQILSIEKMIHVPSHLPACVSPTGRTMPIEIASAAATPMLTDGPNSPQGSSLPSTSVSTIDDATDTAVEAGKLDGTPTEVNGKVFPELVINGL
ncbi:hypothetical protein B2J93_8148 [Marssonina coronariae]|uniref:Pumilio homology domain family member 3 n=1 Tax=Diplocarpon coronariae TaxID=2795749 RepID=A0A218YT77_9HELO|nr:hypothetical protein B2J93_8148 [Marssonina coronariae]